MPSLHQHGEADQSNETKEREKKNKKAATIRFLSLTNNRSSCSRLAPLLAKGKRARHRKHFTAGKFQPVEIHECRVIYLCMQCHTTAGQTYKSNGSMISVLYAV